MGFANRFQLVLFGARQRLGLLEGLFAGELFRPKAPVRIVLEIEGWLGRPSEKWTSKLPHSGTASCLISRIGITRGRRSNAYFAKCSSMASIGAGMIAFRFRENCAVQHVPSGKELPRANAGRPGFSCHSRERRGDNRIGGRAPASVACRQIRRLTMVRRVADNGHRDCLALYFGSLRWDKTAHSRPAPSSLPGPTSALPTSSTARPPRQEV